MFAAYATEPTIAITFSSTSHSGAYLVGPMVQYGKEIGTHRCRSGQPQRKLWVPLVAYNAYVRCPDLSVVCKVPHSHETDDQS